MKITRRQLRRIIREERVRLLREQTTLPKLEFIGWDNERDQTALGFRLDGEEYQIYQSGNVNEEFVAEDLLDIWLEEAGLNPALGGDTGLGEEEYNELLDGMIASLRANRKFMKDVPVMNTLMSAMAQRS